MLPAVPRKAKLGGPAERLRQLIHKLPVPEDGVKEALKLIKACSTDELVALGLQAPSLPVPAAVLHGSQQPVVARLQAVQDVISSLQYNYAHGYYYDVSKARPLSAILATAAAILRDPLPIKCIEAVFLGLLLTQDWALGDLQRLPVGFKSMGPNRQVYRHIVLAVHDPSSGLFGALGISRRANLMYKPLAFSSLAALLADYQEAYRGWSHSVVKVRVGLPVEHDSSYTGPVCWRYCTLNPEKRSPEVTASILNQHAAAAAKLQAKFRAVVAAASTAASSAGSTLPQPHLTRPHTSSAAAAIPASTSTLGSSNAVQRMCGGSNSSSSSVLVMPASPRRLRSVVAHAVATAKNGEAGRAAATSACTSSSNCAGSRSRSRSPTRLRPVPAVPAAGTGPHQTAAGSWQQQQQQPQQLPSPTSASGHECDSSSDDEAEFDSDSEVNGMSVGMKQSPQGVRL